MNLRFKVLAAIFGAMFGLTTAQAQTTQEPAPAPAQKATLYIASSVQEGDTLGASFVAAFIEAIPKDSVDVQQVETKPAPDSTSGTNFRFLTLKINDKTSMVTVVVVRHTKGFENAIYVGAVSIQVDSDTLTDAVSAYLQFLGQVFTNVEEGGYDQGASSPQSTPTPQSTHPAKHDSTSKA